MGTTDSLVKITKKKDVFHSLYRWIVSANICHHLRRVTYNTAT